jgi:hypothetical protein
MSEAELQRAVIELAHRFGWLVAHFRPAQVRPGVWATPVEADGAGFPDLVLARKGKVVFAELKGDRGQVSQFQWQWLHELHPLAPLGDHLAELWRPADWASGRIETILR